MEIEDWSHAMKLNLKTGLSLLGVMCATSLAACSSDSSKTNAPPTDALYTRLGGHAGIRTAVNAIVAEELKDAEIAAFFGAVGTPGHPTADQIEACFTDLLGKAAGGAEVYPTVESGFQCRDMASSHAGLHIPATSFDKFVTIAAGVLKGAGVADADIATIGSVLNGTKADIATGARAPGDAGTTTTLYSRLGGHDGIRTAVNAIVTEELKDAEIAAFFGAVGTPGHPTADQIEACFTDLLGKAAGGAETYPTTESGFVCRDMKTAHASLHIPAATFDKFVTIAAGVLKGAGVADADIAVVGGVLNGTKGDVVSP
jgi:hypothetical protein